MAIGKLKNGKASGVCNIAAEMLKCGGPGTISWLTNIIRHAWESEVLPSDWRKGIILPFYKGKGSRQECKNYRGITLLSVPGKVFAHILLGRVKSRLLSARRREQSGFTPGRSTIDRISTLSTIIQTRREFQQPLWIAYIDLKAAFDSVDREALWLLLRHLGLPLKIVSLMKALYTDTLSCVRTDGATSDWFCIKSGVRQGCILAPDLFATPMDWVLERTVHQGFAGVDLGDENFTDLDYADDISLFAVMLEILQLSLDILNDEAQVFGLEVNWLKTKAQFIGDASDPPTVVAVCNNQVDVVDSFVYLGSLTHNTGSSEPEIRRRIEIARSKMSELNRNIWRSSISLRTKLRLYRVYILPVLLYGCETWTTTHAMLDKLDAFDRWCRRRIMRISYLRHMTNREVMQRTQLVPSVSSIIIETRLRWFGHVARSNTKEDHCRAVSAALSIRPNKLWKRRPGRPLVTWLRSLEDDLGPLNFGLHTAWKKAQNRTGWQQVMSTAKLRQESCH